MKVCINSKNFEVFIIFDINISKIIFLVCLSVVSKFAESLDDATKKNPKLIENKFREYCKTAKNKEERFVSIL